MHLQRNYGVTPGCVEALLAAQGNVCAICSASAPGGRGGWHVDHCHVTGRVRGMLCHACNTGLGLFRDSESLLKKASAYLSDETQAACAFFAQESEWLLGAGAKS